MCFLESLGMSLIKLITIVFLLMFLFQPKNFINDTIRSEFHRKFMDKYVK